MFSFHAKKLLEKKKVLSSFEGNQPFQNATALSKAKDTIMNKFHVVLITEWLDNPRVSLFYHSLSLSLFISLSLSPLDLCFNLILIFLKGYFTSWRHDVF
jgi:hypothetical protein